MLTTEITDQVVIYSFKITIVQQRDTLPQKTDSKLLLDSNYLDNINETHSIAQRFINVLTLQNNDLNIEVDSISELKILKKWKGGKLDGVQFEIDLSIRNIGTSC